MLVRATTKRSRNSLVTFVTHMRFAVLFLPPSCCVNSLIIYYRGLLKWGSTHVPSMNFKSSRFTYWRGGYVTVSILQYCICDSSCYCCSFNPSSCRSPFYPLTDPWGRGPGAQPPTHPTPLSQGLDDCPLPLSEGLDRPLLSVLSCCF